MKIIFCYTDVPNPRAAEAIRKYAPTAEWIRTVEHHTYAKELTSRWDSGEDLVVIEGDKEITAEVIPSFEACDEPWCVYEYWNFPEPYQQNTIYGLGCTKYSAEAQRQIPAEEIYRKHDGVLNRCPDCNNDGCWRYMDTRISFAILSRCISFAPHVHGRVNHHHVYDDEWKRQRGLI